ncbi:DNA-binding transcriptional MerR regulator [Haloactinopolyspora alba]|uniref:DNA-binding transcriptional MerR regulator n=1 Tax=Haloactinopolyspora alba TaxID=648780 RepID=A0A2P8EFC7_9ACTN|nr:MerR family transcriptional regulator [Haloactinopolyspora alba]PSL08163.1 DNA-binding transcriptional MerR regulator [Haloactinopolyspora alba]
MRIGELSRATGVSIRSLRYYEEQRLLAADRTPTGQRVYATDAPDRVRLIQCLYSAGLPSSSIALLLRCESTGRISAGMIDEVRGQQERIARRLEQLTAAAARIDALVDTMVASAEGPPVDAAELGDTP